MAAKLQQTSLAVNSDLKLNPTESTSNRRKSDLSLPGEHVQVPTALFSLLAAGVLSHVELSLWILIKGHCVQSETCWPGTRRLGRFLNLTREWTGELVNQLERKRVLSVERRKGRCHIYRPIIPEPVNSTSQVILSTCELQLTPVVNSTSQPPVNPTSHESYKENQMKEAEYAQPPVANSTTVSSEKKGRKKNSRPSHHKTASEPMTRDAAEQAINALNLVRFVAKYTDLDVPTELDRFKDYYLGKNDPKTGQPNWMKWNDWNRAFHTWLRNARKYSRQQSNVQASGHVPESRNPAFRRFEE
jgi:hypothetical protein